jgi:hypothetical protein
MIVVLWVFTPCRVMFWFLCFRVMSEQTQLQPIRQLSFNPLMLELNPSAQHCLMRVFTGDFAS